jgi:hypothetical protein
MDTDPGGCLIREDGDGCINLVDSGDKIADE